MGKIRVAVVFGGRSSEHAISCLTAGSVSAAIDRDRYEVIPVGIARDGRWVLAVDGPAGSRIDRRPACPRSPAAGLRARAAVRPGAAAA